jgi:type IV pilus assembly protein PilO
VGLIRAIIRIPAGIWFIAFAAYMYLQFNKWQSKTYKPLVFQLSSTKNELQELIEANKASENFEKQKQEKLKEIQKLAEELNRVLDKLPKSSDIPIILSSFADISDRVGLEFSKFEPGQQAKSSTQYFMETPIKVQLRGSFVQIMSFLDEVSHLKRIIVGKGLNLKQESQNSSSKKDSSTSALSAEANFMTYHFDESAR